MRRQVHVPVLLTKKHVTSTMMAMRTRAATMTPTMMAVPTKLAGASPRRSNDSMPIPPVGLRLFLFVVYLFVSE